jgi:hypothetical protein
VPFFEILEINMCANVTDEQKRATSKHREEFFSALYDEIGAVLTGHPTGSSVLLRAEIALVLQPFRTHAALVVLAVWRRIGGDAVLRCRVWRFRRSAVAGAWPGIAL